jgi:hypothetical protein
MAAPNYWLAIIILALRDTEQISRKRQGAFELQSAIVARLSLFQEREVVVKLIKETTYTDFASCIFRSGPGLSSPWREGVPGRLKSSTSIDATISTQPSGFPWRTRTWKPIVGQLVTLTVPSGTQGYGLRTGNPPLPLVLGHPVVPCCRNAATSFANAGRSGHGWRLFQCAG